MIIFIVNVSIAPSASEAFKPHLGSGGPVTGGRSRGAGTRTRSSAPAARGGRAEPSAPPLPWAPGRQVRTRGRGPGRAPGSRNDSRGNPEASARGPHRKMGTWQGAAARVSGDQQQGRGRSRSSEVRKIGVSCSLSSPTGPRGGRGPDPVGGSRGLPRPVTPKAGPRTIEKCFSLY